MEKKNILIIGMMFLLAVSMINIISSDKVEIQQKNGILITDANQENIEKGENYSFQFHLSELDDGTSITDNNTVCHIAIYGKNGENLLHDNLTYTNLTNNWKYKASGELFDRTGEYNYITHCEDRLQKIGGERTEKIEVVPSDEGVFNLNYLDDTASIIIFILLFVMAGAFYYVYTPISALLLIINGFIMMTNGINAILSAIVIMIGILVAFIEVKGGNE